MLERMGVEWIVRKAGMWTGLTISLLVACRLPTVAPASAPAATSGAKRPALERGSDVPVTARTVAIPATTAVMTPAKTTRKCREAPLIQGHSYHVDGRSSIKPGPLVLCG